MFFKVSELSREVGTSLGILKLGREIRKFLEIRLESLGIFGNCQGKIWEILEIVKGKFGNSEIRLGIKSKATHFFVYL